MEIRALPVNKIKHLAIKALPHDNDFVTMRALDAIFAMLKSIIDDDIVVM